MIPIPDSFTPIQTPLPPMLIEMADVTSDSQFLGFFYQGSKATWTDGRACATFNFHQVWHPFASHSAISIPLAILRLNCPDAHFGHDDGQATYMVVADLVANALYIAPWEAGHHFLNQQHPPTPPLSQEELDISRALMLEIMSNPATQELSPTQ